MWKSSTAYWNTRVFPVNPSDPGLLPRYGGEGIMARNQLIEMAMAFLSDSMLGTPSRSKVGTVFERPKDGEHEAEIEKIKMFSWLSCGMLRRY